MQNITNLITPFIWFNNKAEEAINFYTSIFNDSEIESISRHKDDVPGFEPMKGKVLTAVFKLEGQQFMAIDGGPMFELTPAISLFVNCDSVEKLVNIWEKLSVEGTILMPLDTYPFSEKFGWVNDKYGLSWQLSLGSRKQKITPFLMFSGKQNGKAEEAIKFYTSIFDNSNIENITKYSENDMDTEGNVMHAIFSLNGQDFMAHENSYEHPFTFTEATSFYINCKTQNEVDYFGISSLKMEKFNNVVGLKINMEFLGKLFLRFYQNCLTTQTQSNQKEL